MFHSCRCRLNRICGIRWCCSLNPWCSRPATWTPIRPNERLRAARQLDTAREACAGCYVFFLQLLDVARVTGESRRNVLVRPPAECECARTLKSLVRGRVACSRVRGVGTLRSLVSPARCVGSLLKRFCVIRVNTLEHPRPRP